MSTAAREQLSSDVASEVLAALRRIAETEGRPFPAVLDEALRQYIELKHGDGKDDGTRHHVKAAFAESIAEFDVLYRELAK